MTELPQLKTAAAPLALVVTAGERASLRFLEFFVVELRKPYTCRAYGWAMADLERRDWLE